jgi:hypothetical protein
MPPIIAFLSYSLRMEPQFMIMGQSAGTIASLSLDHVARGGAVHDVDLVALHGALLEDGQIMNEKCMHAPAPPTPPRPPAPHKFDPSQHRDDGTGFYVKDSGRQLYRLTNIWHIADSAVAVYYKNTAQTVFPPLTGWVVVTGASPAPSLTNASIVPFFAQI